MSLSKALKKREYLTLLGEAAKKRKRRCALVQLADRSEILAISEIVDNLLRGNLPLKSADRRRLERYKTQLRHIASKKVSIKRKKKLLEQTGGFLSAIIPIAMSLLGGLIGGGKR